MTTNRSSRVGVRLAAVSPFGLAALLALLAVGVQPAGVSQGGAPAAKSGATLLVVAARPQAEAHGKAQVAVTFSKPVVSLSDAQAAAEGPAPARISPAVPGEWRWIGSATVEFVPERPLPLSTEFSVEVPAGLRAIDGSVLAEPYRYKFHTPAPAVEDVAPSPGYAWLVPDQTFDLEFNQPVRDLVLRARLLAGEAGRPIALRVVKETTKLEAELEEARKEPGNQYWIAELQRRIKEGNDKRTVYELKPEQPLPRGERVILVVDQELAGSEGPLTLPNPYRVEYRTYGAMQFVEPDYDAGPWGPCVLHATNEPDLKSLKGKLSVEPPVKIDWDEASAGINDRRRPYASIPADYKAGTTYTLTVADGALDRFGQSAPSFVLQCRTEDIDPEVAVDRNEALLEGTGDGALPIRTVNLLALRARIWALEPGELAQFVATRYAAKRAVPQRAPIERIISPRSRRNVYKWTPLDLHATLPTGRQDGLFLVELSAKAATGDQPLTALAQLSHLAVHAKLGAASSLVYVTDLASGKPVPGATIEVYDASGEVKLRGVANDEGIARMAGLAGQLKGNSWEAERGLVVAARKDAFLGATVAAWSDDLTTWRYARGDAFAGGPEGFGYIQPERGVYRPGDELDLVGVVRTRDARGLRAPAPGRRVELKITDSRDAEVATQTLATNRFGTFSARVPLPKGGALGAYSAQAKIDVEGGSITVSGSFRVEEYRAPQFLVDMKTARESVIAGEPLAAQAVARRLFGAPMAGAAATWSAERSTTDFEPAGRGEYTFGAHTWGWDDGAPAEQGGVFASGEGKTDAAGVLAVKAGIAEAPGSRPWRYTIETEVSDVDRQRIAGRTEIVVHPAAAYVGLKTAEGFLAPGRPTSIGLIAAAPDGALVPGLPLTLTIKERSWKSIRKKERSGEWFTVSEPVETEVSTCAVESAAAERTCAFTPPHAGLYMVEATLTDRVGRTQKSSEWTYVVGPGWASWMQDDTNNLDLVADRPVYEPGQTAKILVKSPWPDAEGLLTVEREGIVSARRIRLAGSSSTVEVPITEEMSPNTYVSVLLTRGRVLSPPAAEGDIDPGRPAARMGFAELKIEKKIKRLAVDVKLDAPEKRPREKVTVELQVNDRRGAGVPAELEVWAVDEGVLRLTDYKPDDPVDRLNPPAPLRVRSLESIASLLKRRRYGDKGADEVAGVTVGGRNSMAAAKALWGGGGGEAAGAGIRSDFKTTVLFMPHVVTDARGHASVSFDLPDNLTTFRVIALAVGEQDRFGLGESKVTVSKPLLALPALPRFVRVGDALEAGIVVHAPKAAARTVEVRAEAEGLRLVGDAARTVELPDGRPREVRFKFAAERPGTARLRFFVAGGGEKDALEQRIPVLLPAALETVAAYGDTTDRRVEALAAPRDARPDAGGLTVTMASSALGGYADAVRQLVEYPYGCVEQLSSRLVPFVAMRELQRAFDVAPKTDEKSIERARAFSEIFSGFLGEDSLQIAGGDSPDDVVRKTIAKIERLQNEDGGFRYWPSSSCPSYDGSSYAVLALARARADGYAVDENVLDKGRKFLADVVAAGRKAPCAYPRSAPTSAERTFAVWALHRSGAPMASYYGRLFDARTALPLYAKAMLADAMIHGRGDAARGRQLLAEVVGAARETAGEVHFQEVDEGSNVESWSSDERTTAIALLVLADDDPGHPYVGKIARWLASARDKAGRYRNTQESAFSLLALTELLRTKEKEVPDFAAEVSLGGAPLARETFRGRSLEARRAERPLADMLALNDGTLTFSKQGAGVLYYSASLRYAPTKIDLSPLDRGIAVQRWFETWDGAKATSFKAGDILRLKVRLATSAERRFVAVSAPLPAGLEVVDPSFATTAAIRPPAKGAQEAEETEGEGDEESTEGPWGEWFWSPWTHEEMRDDRVLAFADELPVGTHTLTVVLRATTAGTFQLPAARAEEMYTPEVFGRSEGGSLVVAPPAD